ncbi:MAG: leucine-rich repeat protein [Lachnospiraceae bacterium]|nr:leucine-rich repeat protein [Lachnospiraceae bacterium]
MKIRKVLATLLCTAVTLTSLGMDVSAAAVDLLPDGEILLQEDPVPVGQENETPVSEENGNTVKEADISGGDELLVEGNTQDNLLSEEPLKAGDKDKPGETLQSEGSVISGDSVPPIMEAEDREATPFRTDTEVLTLIPEYDSLKDWDFDYVVIPAAVKEIPASEKLFQNNEKIKTVTFENANNVSYIESKAFLNSGITKFTVPGGMTRIEDNTFEGCTSLEKLVLNKTTDIGNAAFKGCTSLTSAGISGGTYVVTIGDSAFDNTGFTTLSLSGMTRSEITVGKDVFANCASMTRAVLPAGFKTVPEGCFRNDRKLEKVEIGSKAKIVCKEAFKNCEALKEVTFGNVEEIETQAFDGCKSIEKIDLSSTVYKMADKAFNRCDSLKTLYIRYKDKTTGYADGVIIGDNLVYYPKQLTIYGYEGDVKKYANAKSINYVSLFTDMEVKLGEAYKGYFSSYKFGKVGSKTTGTTIKAKPGETVSVTVTTRSPWIVTKIYDLKDRDGEEIPFSYAAGSGNTLMFAFTMPERPVEVGCDFVTQTMINNGTIGYELTGYDYKYDEVYDSDGKLIGYRTPTTGNKAQLQIYTIYNKTKYPLGTWFSTYKTTNTNIATITKSGLITAMGQGEADITFTVSGKSTRFTIFVTSGVNVKSMEFDQARLEADFYGARYGQVSTVEREFNENGKIVKRTVPLITYYKDDLNNTDQKFKLYLLAYDQDDGEVNVNAAWSVDNKNIAAPATASNYDNENTITVKKGCSGETYIKASVTTNEKDASDKRIVKYAYAVLRVINPAPMTAGTYYMVNKQATYVADEHVEDSNSDGAVIEIIATEGYDIDPAKMGQLLYKDTALNNAEAFKGIKVTYIGPSKDHARGYLYRLSVIEGKNGDTQVNSLKENKSIEYSGKTQLYLRGRFAKTGVEDGLADSFYFVPITKLIIFNQKLKPSVAQGGRINIFYNSKCYEPENNNWDGWTEILGDKAVKSTADSSFQANRTKFINSTIGEISVTQSIIKTSAAVDYDGVYNKEDRENSQEITDYTNDIAGGQSKAVRTRLISERNYAYFVNPNKRSSRETKDGKYFDSFANNFTVTASKNGKDFVIRRSANAMAQFNGMDTTSGYLLIYYKGYKEPFAYKLNLNVKIQAPDYVISPSSGTDNFLNYNTGTSNNIMFEIGLFNKKTSKSVLYSTSDMAAGYPFVDQRSSTHKSGCVYNKAVAIAKFHDPSKDTYVMNIVKNQSYVGKSNAIIHVKKTWWEKEQSYKLTVNEANNLPTGKLSSTTIELNNMLAGPESSATYKVNQGPCTVNAQGGTVTPVPARNQSLADYNKLTVTAASTGAGTQELIIKAKINDNTIPKGSYKFKFTPVAGFTKRDVALKEATFTVKVISSQPTVKLSNVNYNFNIGYPGVETYKVNATFGSIPKTVKPEDYVLDKSAAKLVPTAKAGTAAYNMAMAVGNCFEITKFAYNKDTKKTDFFCKLKDGHGYSDFNCKYSLQGLKLCGATLKPINVTIKSNHGIPSILLSGSGKINTMDKWSYFTVKPTVKNLVNPEFASITYVEWDSNVGDYVTNSRFSITRETNPDKDTTLAYIKATHSKDGQGRDTCTNTDHRLILKYTIGSDILESAEFKLRPVQTAPALTVTPSSAVFYNNAKPEDRVATVELTKTSVLNASVDKTAKNKGIKLSDRNSLELKNAFTVTYSDEGADVVPAPAGATTSKAGKVVIKCIAPELLTMGTTYDLILEPEWNGQFVNSTGSTVTVKVTVK